MMHLCVCLCEQLVSVEASALSASNELGARDSEWQSAVSAAVKLQSSMLTQLQSLTTGMTLASKEAEPSSSVSARGSLQTELDVRAALVVMW